MQRRPSNAQMGNQVEGQLNLGEQIEGQIDVLNENEPGLGEVKPVAVAPVVPVARNENPEGVPAPKKVENKNPEGVPAPKSVEERKDIPRVVEKKEDPYANNTEDQDLALLKTLLEAKAKEYKKGDEALKQLALNLQLYTMNPYHLEEYAPLVFGNEVEMSRGPQKVLWDLLGLTAADLGDQIGKTAETKQQAANALDRIQARIIEKVGVARKERLKTEGPHREKIKAIEAKYPGLKETYQRYTADDKAKVISARFQLKDAGYSVAQVPWNVFRDTILGRFTQFNKDPQGNIRVLPATTKLSSNDVPNNPQLWQAGGIALWSGGMNAPVYMDMSDGLNMRVMVALGATPEQYQKELFAKAAHVKHTEAKVVASIGTVQEATALRSVTQDARKVISDTLNNYLPMPTATILPKGSALLSYSDQQGHWFDTIVIDKSKKFTYWSAGNRKLEMGGSRVIHSGDFQLNGEIKTPVGDRATKSYSHQIILQIPQTAGETNHQYYATASYGTALQKGVARSWGMYVIDSESKAELDKLTQELEKFSNRSGNNDEMPAELIAKIKKLLKDKKPIYSINSTDPFADSGAYGLQMSSVYFSKRHQRSFAIRWGIPLNFELQAKHGKMNEMAKLMDGDLEKITESAEFQKYLDDLVANEYRKEASNSTNSLTTKQIADLHDAHRDTGAELLKLRDAKAELVDQITKEGEGRHDRELHAKFDATMAALEKCERTFNAQRSELKDYVPLNPVNLGESKCDSSKFILDAVGLESQTEMDYILAQEELRGLVNSPEVTESLGKVWGTFFSATSVNAEPDQAVAPVNVAGDSRCRYVRRRVAGR